MSDILNLSQAAVAILPGSTVAGHHEMTLLTPEIALLITGRPKLNDYRRHLIRLLSNTALAGITWINLSLGQIHLEHIPSSQIR